MADISSIAARMPLLNEEAQRRLAAGRAMQVQTIAQQAQPSPTMPITRVAQQAAPQIIQQQGDAALQQQAQAAQQQAAVGQAALQQQGAQAQLQLQQQELAQKQMLGGQAIQQSLALSREQEQAKNRLSSLEIDSNKRLAQLGLDVDNNLSFMSTKQREDLAKIGGDVKQQLFDSRMQFQKDDLGRKFSNDRQLSDWAIASAKDEIELNTRLRELEQASTKELIMLEAANTRIAKALERGYLDDKRELDQNQTKALAQLKMQLDEKIRKKKAKAANDRLIAGGVITIAGVATGGVGGAVLAGVGSGVVSNSTSQQ